MFWVCFGKEPYQQHFHPVRQGRMEKLGIIHARVGMEKWNLLKIQYYKYIVILVATGILDGDHINVSKNWYTIIKLQEVQKCSD